MIALSTEDPESSAESVRDFVREYEVDYQVGWATRDVAITLMQGRTSIPQSFIIGRDGRIVKRFIGFDPNVTPAQLKKALEEQGWDGDWYRRAYFDDGTPLGSVQNDECRIDSIVQSWGVISGAAFSRDTPVQNPANHVASVNFGLNF